MTAVQDIVQRLREAAGTGDGPARRDIEATDFDWSVPHHFTARQMERLGELLDKAARDLSRRLSEQLQGAFDVRSGELEQLYQRSFRQEERPQGEYALPIHRQGGEPCGLLLVSRADAVALVTTMLGSSEQGESDRELSALESDLLGYLLGSTVQTFSETVTRWGGPGLEQGPEVLEDERPLPEATSELCRVRYTGDQQDTFATLVLSAEVFAEAVRDEAEAAERSPDQVRADMRAHFERAPVEAVARLGTALVPMRQVADLAEGDVLVLPAKVDTPMIVEAQGKAVLEGHPVASRGRCAVKVARRLGEP
jgi:flagellar motor switch protein FliM